MRFRFLELLLVSLPCVPGGAHNAGSFTTSQYLHFATLDQMFLNFRRVSQLGRVQSSEALASAGGTPPGGLGHPGFPGLRDAKFRATLIWARTVHGMHPPLTRCRGRGPVSPFPISPSLESWLLACLLCS